MKFSRVCKICGDHRHGKPRVVGREVDFSLSHSGAVIMVAVAGVPVGVDVEAVGSAGRISSDVVRRSCSVRERVRLGEPLDETRERDFLRLWTRKEAVTKVTGIGIVGDLSCVDVLDDCVRLDGGRTIGITSTAGSGWIAATAAPKGTVFEPWAG